MSENGQTNLADLATLPGCMLDPVACFRALCAKDARFDGHFYVGVSTTGIYCRPICRARTPGANRCTYYARAVDAERAGFRACFRCRPELAPGHAQVDALSRHVRQAVARIDEGALNEASLESLATSIGISSRHLRRAMEHELGVSPVTYAQSRRLALAKQLLHETALPLADVAFAAGFRSVRRFNAAFSSHFRAPPSRLRGIKLKDATGLTLRLDYRPPIAWEALLGFLHARAIAGVEWVENGVYERTLSVGERRGKVRVSHLGEHVQVAIDLSLAPVAMTVVAKLRALFDLDADPAAVAATLCKDRSLRGVLARYPGLRVPGTVDPFEIGVRAILGQQVTVRAATTLCGRFALAFGAPFAPGCVTFPLASTIAACEAGTLASAIKLPLARAHAIVALARSLASGALKLDRGQDPHDAMAGLVALPGIGPWTASYIAMRALSYCDALPATDLVLRQTLGTQDVETRAKRWSPWRAYGVLYTWKLASEQSNV